MEGKVIIMDPSEHEREKLKHILGNLNINRIIEVTNSYHYLQSPDLVEDACLIILDAAFPYEKDGIEVLDHLRKTRATSGVPIIITTRSDKPEFRAECLKFGVSDYIKKPYEIKRLIASIKSIIKLEKAFSYNTEGISSMHLSFERFLERELKIADRHKAPLSLLFITAAAANTGEIPSPLPSEVLREYCTPSGNNTAGILRSYDAFFYNTNGDVLLILPFTGKDDSEVVSRRLGRAVEARFKEQGLSFGDTFYSVNVTYPDDGGNFQSIMETAFKKISDKQLLEKIASIPLDTRKYAKRRYNQFNRWF